MRSHVFHHLTLEHFESKLILLADQVFQPVTLHRQHMSTVDEFPPMQAINRMHAAADNLLVVIQHELDHVGRAISLPCKLYNFLNRQYPHNVRRHCGAYENTLPVALR